MAQFSGFIDYDPNGKAYMGLIVNDPTVQVKFYIAHKGTAIASVRQLAAQLEKVAVDLGKTPDKLLEAKGMPDGFQGTQRERKG